MHMAPPDQNKKGANGANGDGHAMGGDGDGERGHPCESSEGGLGPTPAAAAAAVDQEHKACDVHTQGE